MSLVSGHCARTGSSLKRQAVLTARVHAIHSTPHLHVQQHANGQMVNHIPAVQLDMAGALGAGRSETITGSVAVVATEAVPAIGVVEYSS